MKTSDAIGAMALMEILQYNQFINSSREPNETNADRQLSLKLTRGFWLSLNLQECGLLYSYSDSLNLTMTYGELPSSDEKLKSCLQVCILFLQ